MERIEFSWFGYIFLFKIKWFEDVRYELIELKLVYYLNLKEKRIVWKKWKVIVLKNIFFEYGYVYVFKNLVIVGNGYREEEEFLNSILVVN